MSVEAVLLDLDGTLVDTAPDLVSVLNTLLARRDLPPVPFAIGRNEVSNGAVHLIQFGFGAALSAAALAELRQEFLEIYTRKVCINSRIFSGLDDVLMKLDEEETPWGIVTNKPHAMTVPLLGSLGLSERPACVISGDRLPQRKPHPAPLHLAAEELGVRAERCVYVGDAPRDIEAGRAAGMTTIAAAYGYIRGHDDPYGWGASAVIRRPRDLGEAVEALC